MPIVFYDSLKEFSDSLPSRSKERYETTRDPWAGNLTYSEARERLTKFLNINPQDMLIDGAYLQDKLMSEPLEWVNDQVKRYASVLDS